MAGPLRVLIVEDSEDDARLLRRKLQLAGYDVTSERVDSADAMRSALAGKPWDLILCDYVMPGFGGLEALAIARESGLDLPCIVVSGKIDERTAVDTMKAGASDFVAKARLEWLAPVVERELAAAAARRGMRQAQIEWRAAFDSMRDACFFHDSEFRIVRANLAYAALARMPVEEVIGKRYWEVFPKRDGPLPGCRALTERREGWVEEEIDLPDGEVYVSRSSRILDDRGEYLYSFHLLQDVTERKRSEQALRLFRELIDRSSDAIEVVDPQTLRYLDVNERACQDLGYGREELLSMRVHEIDPALDPAALEQIDRQLRETGSANFETVHRRKDGSSFPVEIHVKRIQLDRPYQVASVRDITERKQAQAELERSERHFRKLIEGSADAFFVIDGTGTVRYRSPSAKGLTGRDEEEVLGTTITDYVAPEHRTRARDVIAETIRAPDKTVEAELRLLHKDGTLFDAEVTGRNLLGDPDVHGIVVTVRDITERKRGEEQLQHLNWALRALGQSNSALVHAGSERELFRRCCEAITSAGGYPLAWIGIARDDPERTVEVVAAAGQALAYAESLKVSWGENPLGEGPAGTAIRTATTQMIGNLAASPTFAPWREKARASGLASAIALPISAGSAAPGILNIYSQEVNAFGKAEIELFEELASDIGYGVAARRTRAAYEKAVTERAEQAVKLRATFESAIAALAATVEQRDPYTAGHQRRVAVLATAIGRELGLDEDRLEGLRVASTIHDIGKIYVPAEILARPGRLSAAEFEIVKNHAQVGYDIVKGVDFPWPVAETIRQHHERLDGSGYPQGLKGERIILEARILAVADVVEAIASHRPYRAAVGIGPGLQHVAAEAGRLYDAEAAAACVRLFNEKRFELPAAP